MAGNGERNMNSLQIGDLKLFVNSSSEPDQANVPGKPGRQPGRRWAGVVLGPGELVINLRYFISDTGDALVDCTAVDDVHHDQFMRLLRGARLGVYQDSGTAQIRQLRVIRHDPAAGWGQPTMTSLGELEQLGGGAIQAIRAAGITKIGSKAEVLGTRGDDIAVVWSQAENALIPLALYTLTRVLPMFEAGLQ